MIRNGSVLFNIANKEEQVTIDIFDLSGRLTAKVLDKKLDRGRYRINPLPASQAGRMYLVRIKIGPQTTVLKVPYATAKAASCARVIKSIEDGCNIQKVTDKSAPAIDTLEVSAAGYASVKKAISSYAGVNDFLMTPAGGHRGSISFENGSYQSCLVPLVITVVDSDLTAATIPVQVKSTTDTHGITIPLKKNPDLAGTYSDSAFFSIVKSDSARRFIRVRDGDTVTATYTDDSPAGLCLERTVWNGLPGNVQPKGSPIFGVIHGLGITLWDSDIMDSAVTIAVWSKKDTVGLRVSLAKVALSSGDYIGKIGLSLKRSRGDSVLAVGPGSDTIFMRYHDLTPEADIMGNGCLWQPMSANMFLDSAQYHGTASVMTINLTDDDIEDSTVVVTIKSATDAAGITDTLKAAGGMNRYFGGRVGFTSGASAPGRISVADGDSIWVSYQEETPVRLVTQGAVWSSK